MKGKTIEKIQSAFAALVDKIKVEQNKYIISSLNNRMRFYADFGEEFKFNQLKDFLSEKNIFLFNIGSPKKKLPYLIERFVRTFRNSTGMTINI